jgi:pre-mRNA-processing factor 6
MASGRKDFLSQPAPENYVAGLGRGATGFTTRSDLGPAREGPTPEQIQAALAKRAQLLGAAPPTAYGASREKGKGDEKPAEEEDDERFQDPDNEVGLFAYGQFDQEDDEADRIYKEVDEKMDRRRKVRRLVNPQRSPSHGVICSSGLAPVFWIDDRLDSFSTSREARERQEREDYERKNPKIQQQFADLKRSLASVSEDEWANLPEVGDLTGKNRRTKQNLRMQQRFYAVPDSVLASARDSSQFDTTVADDGSQTDGRAADGADGMITNFANISAARDKVLQVKLDQAAMGSSGDTTSGSATSIDPKGYLTSLTQSELKAGEIEVGDIKRVRVLLESVTRTNPKHAPGWIALARLEELAGKIVTARNILAKGCDLCPKSEDAWLENIRLNEGHNAKVIAANAIKNNDRSTRLWIEAMRLETEPRAKKNVLRQAILHIPQSVTIWKEAVNLEEDPADARLLLAKAVEMIPLSVELWLALARLETPENAQKVLNAARKAVPTSHEIWIAASRLQEQMGTFNKVNVMKRAIQSLARENAMLKREEWIAEAEKCEEEGAVLTCGAIIRETLGWGLDEDDDRKDIWMDDAKASIAKGKYETARAIYAYALRVFVNRKSIWVAAADLERNHGTKEALWQVLEKAVEACPQSEELWLQLAKEKWQSGEIDDARRVLGRAFNQNPNNEDIWLAAVKLEADAQQTDQARELLATARREAGTDRVWIKSVAFERQLGNINEALDLVNQGLQVYPKADKLWMMKGQIYESQNKVPQAREAYGTGTRACSKSVPLWLLASRLEEKAGAVVRARSVLDRARLAVPNSPELWTESVRVERRANNIPQAKVLMARALQEVPSSGLLWSESIWYLEPRAQRKARSLEAIKKVENDPLLFITVARIFWGERRLEKAMTWFEKAIVSNSDLGDAWAWYYKFLLQHGTDVRCYLPLPLTFSFLPKDSPSLTTVRSQEKRADVISKCILSEPKHGELWQSIAKDPANAYKSTEEILKLVADSLSQ